MSTADDVYVNCFVSHCAGGLPEKHSVSSGMEMNGVCMWAEGEMCFEQRVRKRYWAYENKRVLKNGYFWGALPASGALHTKLRIHWKLACGEMLVS